MRIIADVELIRNISEPTTVVTSAGLCFQVVHWLATDSAELDSSNQERRWDDQF